MVQIPSTVLFDACACALLAVYPALCTNPRQPFACCLGVVRLHFFSCISDASLELSRILGIPQSTRQRLNHPQASCPQSDTPPSFATPFLQPSDRIHKNTHVTAPCHITHQSFPHDTVAQLRFCGCGWQEGKRERDKWGNGGCGMKCMGCFLWNN